MAPSSHGWEPPEKPGRFIGEATFWTLMPSTVATWVFLCVFYTHGLLPAAVSAMGTHVVAAVLGLLMYSKSLNYLVFVFGNAALQGVAYALVAVACWRSGQQQAAAVLSGAFVMYQLALPEVIVGLVTLPVNRFVGLPTSDQCLRLVGWRYGVAHGQNPLEWKTHDDAQ